MLVGDDSGDDDDVGITLTMMLVLLRHPRKIIRSHKRVTLSKGNVVIRVIVVLVFYLCAVVSDCRL